jgi:hypothetical protein
VDWEPLNKVRGAHSATPDVSGAGERDDVLTSQRRPSRLRCRVTAFAILLVVVDPFGVLPIFISLAKNRPTRERTRIATRAVLLGFMISLFFLVAGLSALAFLGVSVHALSISGAFWHSGADALWPEAGIAVGGDKREWAQGYCDFSSRHPAYRSGHDYEHSTAYRPDTRQLCRACCNSRRASASPSCSRAWCSASAPSD